MDAMRVTLDAMASKPTIFFRCRYAINAVSLILDVDMLDYSMPQSNAEIAAFSWNDVKVGDTTTYPKGHDPTEEEFRKVWCVFKEAQAKRDKECNKVGLTHSGPRSYITFKQQWK